LVNYELYSYEIIFFTAKNLLVILLQLYRVTAVIHTRRSETKQKRKNKRLAPLVMNSAGQVSTFAMSSSSSKPDLGVPIGGYTPDSSTLSKRQSYYEGDEEEIKY